jgi:uncharacterized protein
MTLFGLKKEVYISTIASIALLVDFTRIPLYFGNGFLEAQYFWYIPVLFFIAFLGSFVGKKIVARVDSVLLKKVILGGIILMSVVLIIQGYSSL